MEQDERLLHASSFGAAAAAYAEHRPHCAQAAVRWALEPAPGSRVLDLGAGTGKLTATWPISGVDRGRTAVTAGRSSLIARARASALVRRVGGRPGALVELIGLLLWFLLFTRLHSAAGKDIAAATANALSLQSTEHAVHIDIERSANDWLAGHLVLSHLAVYLYRLYYAVIAGVLLWCSSGTPMSTVKSAGHWSR